MLSFTCTCGRIITLFIQLYKQSWESLQTTCTFNHFVCYLDQPRLIEWYFCMNQGLGTGKPARVKRNFELSDLELSEVNLVTLWRKKFGTGGKTRVIRKFELSEFELTGFNCRCVDQLCSFEGLKWLHFNLLWVNNFTRHSRCFSTQDWSKALKYDFNWM